MINSYSLCDELKQKLQTGPISTFLQSKFLSSSCILNQIQENKQILNYGKGHLCLGKGFFYLGKRWGKSSLFPDNLKCYSLEMKGMC